MTEPRAAACDLYQVAPSSILAFDIRSWHAWGVRVTSRRDIGATVVIVHTAARSFVSPFPSNREIRKWRRKFLRRRTSRKSKKTRGESANAELFRRARRCGGDGRRSCNVKSTASNVKYVSHKWAFLVWPRCCRLYHLPYGPDRPLTSLSRFAIVTDRIRVYCERYGLGIYSVNRNVIRAKTGGLWKLILRGVASGRDISDVAFDFGNDS